MNARARAAAAWQSVRSSYWFLPALAALLAIALWYAADRIDRETGDIYSAGWIYGGSASGARELVAAVAASTITVAGVIFSVTIVTLSLASQQFGPRLLRTFMRDLGNQVVLATFIGTFLYSLLVLREIRGEDGGPAYIPGVSITIAVALAMLSVALLVYFIHHTATAIRAERITSVVGHDLLAAVRSLFPGDVRGHAGEPATESESWTDTVVSVSHGYILQVTVEDLARVACEAGVVVRLNVRPGTFVTRGELLLQLSAPVAEEVCEKMRDACVISSIRTSADPDVEAVVQQLSQITLRALSPALNDPFTAVQCIDWLKAALSELAEQPPPISHVEDEQGAVRVIIAKPFGFAEVLRSAFDPLRPAAMKDPTAAFAVLRTLEAIAARARRPQHRSAVIELATAMHRAAEVDEEFSARLEDCLVRIRSSQSALAVRGMGGAGPLRGPDEP